MTSPAAPQSLRQPASCGELFSVFNRLALQGFGGVLPVAHRALVDRERWLSPQQFVELLTIGQVLPGPNIINISIILGDRFFGWRGALAATAGLLLLPLVIVLGLAMVYQQFAHLPQVAGALRGMGVVAAGLVMATAVMVGGLRWPRVYAVLALGGLGVALAWRQLRDGGPPR